MRTRLGKTLHLLTAVLVFGLLMVLPIKGQVVHADGTYGGLTIKGGTENTDYSYDSSSGKLTIKSNKAMTITGTSREVGNAYLYIASGVDANLTLDGVTIRNYTPKVQRSAIEIAENSTGNVTLTLKGENLLDGYGYPAIQKNGKSGNVGWLIIKGTDSDTLTASTTISGLDREDGTVDAYPAAIGGAGGKDGAKIQFDGGKITINSFASAAIGGGANADGTDIVINDGTINATLKWNETYNVNDTSFPYGAVIGGGYNGNGKNITINGGTVTVTANETNVTYAGAGIGGGACPSETDKSKGGKGENIVINGGTVIANVGFSNSLGGSAAIGGGFCNYSGGNSVTINGGQVTATSSRAAGIGSGFLYHDPDASIQNDTITITGGTVTATGKEKAAGIGVGDKGSVNVYISGGSINAIPGTTPTSNYEADKIGLSSTAKYYSTAGYKSTVEYSKEDTEEVVLRKEKFSDKSEKVTPYLINTGTNEEYKYGTKDLYTDAQGYLYLYLKKSIADKIEVRKTELAADECRQDFSIIINRNGSAWTDAGDVTLVGTQTYKPTKNGNQYTFSGVFKKGTYKIYRGTSDTGMDITLGDATVANKTLNYYSVTVSKPEHGTISDAADLILSGVSYKFKVAADSGDYKVSEVTYTIGNGSKNKLTESGGWYTIPGTVAITGPVTLSAVMADGRGTPIVIPDTWTWNYTGPYFYKGDTYKVELKNIPTGVDYVDYTDNSQSEIGTYTAKATLVPKNGYYVPDGTSIPDCNWEIKEYTIENINSILRYNGETTKKDWYNGNVTVTADGYQISESSKGAFNDSIIFDVTGSNTLCRKTLYFKDKSKGYITTTGATVEVKIDTVPPTGSISLDGQTYTSRNTQSAVQRHHLSDVQATFNSTDSESGIASVQYLVSDQYYTEAQLKSLSSWTEGKSYSLKENTNQAVYVRIEDNVGNVAYLSTPIIYNDTKSPVGKGGSILYSSFDRVDYELTFAEACDCTYVLLSADAAAPKDLQSVEAAMATAIKSGKVTNQTVMNGTFMGLLPNTSYYLYYILSKELTNLSGVSNPLTSEVYKIEILTEKIVKTVADQTLLIKKSEAGNTYTYDLEKLLQSVGVGVSDMINVEYMAEPEAGYIVSGTPTVMDNKLLIKLGNDLKEEDSQKISITIKSDNYRDIQFKLIVKIVSKTPVTLSGVVAENAVYDGKPHSGYNGTISWKDSDGVSHENEGYTTITYSTKYTSDSSKDEPVNAYDAYEVTFTFNSDEYIGEQTHRFAINKADVDMENVKWYLDNETSPFDPTKVIYADGKEHKLIVKGYPENIVEPVYTDNTGSAAGPHTAVADFKFVSDTMANNYNKPMKKAQFWEIKEQIQEGLQQPLDMSAVKWVYTQEGLDGEITIEDENNVQLPANGKAYTMSLEGLPEVVTATYSEGQTASEVGEYTVTASFEVDDPELYVTPDARTLVWKIVEEEELNPNDPIDPNPGDDPNPNDPVDPNPPVDPGNQNPAGGAVTPEPPAATVPSVGAQETVNNQKYTVTSASETGGTVEYIEPTDKNVKTVSIPSSIQIGGQEYVVTSIAKNAFKGCNKLTKVTVPNTVTTIGTGAFQNCKKLKTVKLGSGLTKIGDKAFYNCIALKKITIPKKVTTIGKQTFSGCKNLKTITIKSTVLKKVGAKAIKGINSKATIKCPNKKVVEKYKKLFKSKTGYVKTMKIK